MGLLIPQFTTPPVAIYPATDKQQMDTVREERIANWKN
jgi:hypothetical protein